MSVPGCTWVYIAVPGCNWLYLTVPSCAWLYLAVPCCTWPFLATHSFRWLYLAVPSCTWVYRYWRSKHPLPPRTLKFPSGRDFAPLSTICPQQGALPESGNGPGPVLNTIVCPTLMQFQGKYWKLSKRNTENNQSDTVNTPTETGRWWTISEYHLICVFNFWRNCKGN